MADDMKYHLRQSGKSHHLVACNSRFGSATTGLILSGSVLSENLTTDFTVIGR